MLALSCPLFIGAPFSVPPICDPPTTMADPTLWLRMHTDYSAGKVAADREKII
jgi:hypothetical protein